MSNHERDGSDKPNRDAALERAWREVSDERPPAHLDAVIVAAARQSVPDRDEQPKPAPVRVQSRNWLMQWQPLAAAATVAGLAFVLVQMLPREHDLAPSMQRKESAPVPASAMPQPQPQTSTAHETIDDRQAPSTDKTVARPERVAVPDQAPSKGAAFVPPPPSPSSPAREGNLDHAAPLDAAAWAAKIVALHAVGDVTAAEQVLRAFRAADPDADASLPDSLRNWARTVE